MAIQRRDPYRNFNFRVAIGGRARANDGFSAVRLPTLLTRPDVAVDATTQLGRGFATPRPPARLHRRHGPPRVVDARTRAEALAGRVVTVELLDETNTEVAVAWRFIGCRPVALHYSPLDALEAAVVTETIVLAFDDVEMS